MTDGNESDRAGAKLPAWKRPLDLLGGALGLIVSSPLIMLGMLLVALSDGRNPLYVSERIGRHGRTFRFIKIRTMIPNAAASRVDTTIAGDARLLPAGRLIRRFKLDELPQFWHVLRGQMSLVGPRPNVPREVALYTQEERRLLDVRPGITDFSSIVFADLAEVLANSADANIAYNQLVRPWKSELGLHYLQHMSLWQDIKLTFYTVSSMFARRWTLQRIVQDLRATRARDELCDLAMRTRPLAPRPPPGGTAIVTSR